jgi:hypothetical protein
MKTRQSQPPHAARLLRSVTEKLHPKRFPKMSGRMAAIVAFLIDAQVTRPTIIEIVVTSDGFVLAGVDDEVGTNLLVGSYSDFVRNWRALIAAVAGLSKQEHIAAETLFASKVGYFGSADA